MSWECADCRQKEMVAICHHCGKPVCGEHSSEITDDAFAASEPLRSRAAVHCQECRSKYHSRATGIERAGIAGVASQ